jgi:hypothetical protein
MRKYAKNVKTHPLQDVFFDAFPSIAILTHDETHYLHRMSTDPHP